MIIHVQVFYAGRVQGVGFRYSVKQIAAGYEVTGWVRNLPDGRVELQAGGDAEELTAFLQAIGASHLAGYIKETTRVELPSPPDQRIGFAIRH